MCAYFCAVEIAALYREIATGAKRPRNDVFFVFAYVRLYGECSVSYVFARSAEHDVAIRS